MGDTFGETFRTGLILYVLGILPTSLLVGLGAFEYYVARTSDPNVAAKVFLQHLHFPFTLYARLLLDYLNKVGGPSVIKGLVNRVFFGLVGAFWTYAFVRVAGNHGQDSLRIPTILFWVFAYVSSLVFFGRFGHELHFIGKSLQERDAQVVSADDGRLPPLD